ncbi:MAG: phage portal protein [Gammaproteobacteria bacterium]|nr:phage portal protein [Gammaproteobacteria bacterium]
MRLPWRRRRKLDGVPERRTSSYEADFDAALAAGERADESFTEFVENLAGDRVRGAPAANGLAALEVCAGLTGRAFAAADVDGDMYGIVTPDILETIGRELEVRGESVFVIDMGAGGMPMLHRCGSWYLYGGLREPDWWYLCNEFGPSRHLDRYRPSASVLHFRRNVDPVRPWLGRAPWRIANLTAGTAARAESAASRESAILPTRIAPAPINNPEDRKDYARRLRRGGIVVAKSVLTNVAQMTGGQEPSSRWEAQKLGPDLGAGQLELRSRSALDVMAAHGVPPALFDRSDGSAAREAYRRWTLGTLAPLGRLVALELSRKLDLRITIRFDALAGADLATRGRALRQLVDAGVPLDEARQITGLQAPATNA